MRPGDTITSQTTGRTLTVVGVRKEVTWNQDETYGELRVIVREGSGRDTCVVAKRSGGPLMTDAQVEAAFAQVENDLIAKARAWVDR